MGTILALGFLLGVPSIGIFVIVYLRRLRAIAEFSNDNDADVFGTKYQNVYQLYSDISFLNALWSSECDREIKDETLSKLIVSAHRLLRVGVVVGIAIILLPILWRIVEIGSGT